MTLFLTVRYSYSCGVGIVCGVGIEAYGKCFLLPLQESSERASFRGTNRRSRSHNIHHHSVMTKRFAHRQE